MPSYVGYEYGLFLSAQRVRYLPLDSHHNFLKTLKKGPKRSRALEVKVRMSSAAPLLENNPFAPLGLDASLLRAIDSLGYQNPTPIQQQAIPALLEGRDMLGQAATGTGKTAAFALPMLQRIIHSGAQKTRGKQAVPQGLVLVPTRELCMQVAAVVAQFASCTQVGVTAIFGGQEMRLQLRALALGPRMVIATPGRLLDHMHRRSIDLQQVQMLALDEADEMLDRGFADDLATIFQQVPRTRQTVMFSATVPPRVAHMAQNTLHEPAHVKIAVKATAAGACAKVEQIAYLLPAAHKAAALRRLMQAEAPAAALVFCRTRDDVESLVDAMGRANYRCEPLHGGMSQAMRDKVMVRFRNKSFRVLVATDVAARGLDIDHISHVVNYDLPEAAEVYLHRIGRTGRAGRSGTAISFVKPNQLSLLAQTERHTRVRMTQSELPSPHRMQDVRAEQDLQAVQAAVHKPESQAAPSIQAAQLVKDYTPMQLAQAALVLARPQPSGSPQMDEGALGLPWSVAQAHQSTGQAQRRHRPHQSGSPARSQFGRQRHAKNRR